MTRCPQLLFVRDRYGASSIEERNNNNNNGSIQGGDGDLPSPRSASRCYSTLLHAACEVCVYVCCLCVCEMKRGVICVGVGVRVCGCVCCVYVPYLVRIFKALSITAVVPDTAEEVSVCLSTYVRILGIASRRDRSDEHLKSRSDQSNHYHQHHIFNTYSSGQGRHSFFHFSTVGVIQL